MNWLALIFSLELGLAPQVGVLQYEPWQWDHKAWQIGYTELQAEVELFNLLFAGGGVRTYITPAGGLNFSPNSTIYDFRAGLRRGPVEIGWRHRCFHPTIAYLPVLDINVTGLEGGYDEIYFRIQARSK